MRKVLAVARPQQGFSIAHRFAAAGVLAVATIGATFNAHAQGMGGPGGMPGHGMHGPDGGAGMMWGGHGMERMLDGLGLSDAQRAQIKQIRTAAAADLKAQHEAGRALREKGMQIFTAPTVDAAAAESLRAQMSAQHDQASKRMLQAMLDVSKVLTPEQRAKIGERMKDRQAIMRDRMQRMEREHPPRAVK